MTAGLAALYRVVHFGTGGTERARESRGAARAVGAERPEPGDVLAWPADVDDDELAARQADAVAQFVNDDGDAD